MAANDDWADTQQAEINASGLAPSDPREAALITTLQPGAYTVIESGFQGGQGVGLVEVYDADGSALTQLVNISTRSLVQGGDNVMIGGIIVGGAQAGRFILRAIGPSLAAAGIANPLPNPLLEIYDSQGNRIGLNDDWREAQEAELQASGLAPTHDRESAISGMLVPGAYTAIVRSINGSITGIGLVEIYRQ